MKKVSILGLGLMCLDIVYYNGMPKIMSGGSCANVISVLAQVGMNCTVLREKYSDSFESVLYDSLSAFGVKQTLYKNTSLETPRVIELLDESHHDFLTWCPKCGKKVLNIHMPTVNNITKVDSIQLKDFELLYCDRTSKGIIHLMDVIHENNGLVVYEPNSGRNLKSLLNSAKHADIVKFSNQRISFSIANQLRETSNLKMIIVTMGEKGLMFSHVCQNGKMSDWIEVKSEFKGPIVDASGAGDWLSAGFIVELINNDLDNNSFYSSRKLSEMLAQGMKYSQLCCASIGAQGVFYSDASLDVLKRLSNRDSALKGHSINSEYNTLNNICPYCYSKIS